MGFDDIDSFEFEGVEEEHVAGGGGNVGGAGWGVGWWGERGGEGFLGKWIGEVAVLGGGREGADGLDRVSDVDMRLDT